MPLYFKFWKRQHGQSSLTQAFAFPLAIIAEAPVPGLKLAATALQEIIRRAACIDENKAGLTELAAQMEYLLFLSSKVKGDTGNTAVEKLLATTEEIGRKIPEDRQRIIAFFLADETKAKIQALASQLGTAVQIFQVALQLNTDEKVEEVHKELRAVKLSNEATLGGSVLQELKNIQLNAKGKLNFSVLSSDRVHRDILNTEMRSSQGFNSVVIGHEGVNESLQDSVIESDGNVEFTTIAGSPADFAEWSDVLRG